MRLRNHLLLVVLAGLLPVVLLATVTGYLLIDEQRDTFRRGAEERSLAMLSAVDAQLRGAVNAIQVLSQSESLGRGDLASFRASAQRVLDTQPDWSTITVALPDGRRVLDLLVPEGEALPAVPREEDSFERVLQARAPVIGNLASGMATSSWSYAVRNVVMRGDDVRYVLTAVVRPDAMARLVQEQNLPEGLVGVVLDAENKFVARTVDPEAALGQLPAAPLIEALARAPSGFFRWTTGTGADVYTAYHKSAVSGWTLGLGIPSSVIDASTTRPAAIFGAGLVGALVLALMFARIVGQRIAGPMAALAVQAEAARKGELSATPRSFGVSEIDEFARTLHEVLAALRTREERLQLALRTGRMGIWEWNPQTKGSMWSPEMHAIHGYMDRSDAGNFEAYLRVVHPEDRDAVQHAITQGITHGEHHIEYRIVRPDGAVRWLEAHGKLMRDESAERRYMIGVCTDITERKRAEADLQESESRFRDMADAAPAMLWVAAADGKTTFLSRGWYEYTGQTERIAFGNDGFGWLDAVHPDDRDKSARAVSHAVMQRDAFTIDYRLRRADGTYRWSIDNGKPRFDAVGNFLGFVGAVIDIDDRKRAEDALRASERALREADRHKDDFLATLSHELRNPLAALATASHVLRARPPADATTSAVYGVIDRQTQHMVRLIEDLLDMTRIRLGKVSLKRAPVDLGALVREATEARRSTGYLAGRARVSVDAESVWIHGDAARLEQIYMNLLDNALKFTPVGGAIHVTVSQQGACAVLTVRDDGQGIAPEFLPGVFDLFVQGDQAPGRTRGGLGLGLALVRRLAEVHGGTVHAASPGKGHGATFTVSLPAIAAEQVVESPAFEQPAMSGAALRVLLVEDNSDVRQMTRASLELAGYYVLEAASGTEGLALAAECRPDVVLLDIGLPDIDGYEVAQGLRALYGNDTLTLVALSGHGEDASRARAAGFDAHLVKPGDVDTIVALIERLRRREPVTPA